MPPILIAVLVLAAGGAGALLLSRRPRLSEALGAGGAVAGCAVGLWEALRVLVGGRPAAWSCAWSVPFGSFAIEVDALSAFFLLPVLGLSLLAAAYGTEYLAAWRGRKALGPSWLFFNALVANMVLVIVARNAVLFLVAWELMSLASFFLVTFEHEREDVRRAGWTYLVATHIGTAFLLALFVLLDGAAGRSTSPGSVRGPPRPPASCSSWPWWVSARRPVSCRSTSGCRRRTRPRRATCRR